MPKPGCVYLLTNKRNGTLYTGVTSELKHRIYLHKTDKYPGFTHKYKLNMLVYFEEHDDIQDAIEREKRIKKWQRSWKLQLIEKLNPGWKDLYDEL